MLRTNILVLRKLTVEYLIGSLLFLPFVNDMNEAVDCDLVLYAHDPCLVYQHKNIKK